MRNADEAAGPAGASTGPGDAPGEASSTRSRAALLGAAVFASIAAYADILPNQFVWDDRLQIAGNPDLRHLGSLGKAFSGPVWSFLAPHGDALSSYYRPLQALTYTLVYQVSGLAPGGYHVASILFHALATAALFLVAEELSGNSPLAFVAALLFAVYPVHTEAVSWISALPELECAFFYLACLYCWIRWRRAPADEPRRRLWLVAACGAFFLALLAKEMAGTLPLALLLYEHFFGAGLPPSGGRTRFRAAGFAAVGATLAAYLVLRSWALGGLRLGGNGHELTAWQYVLSDFALLGRYFQKVFLPLRLDAYYVFHPSTSLVKPDVLLGAAWALVCLVALGMGPRWPSRLRLPIFAVVWIPLTLLPALAIRQVGYNVFAERYLYLPSAGACLAAAVALWELFRRASPTARLLVATLTLALVVSLSVETVRRNRVWKDDFTLCQATIKASPGAAPMYNGLGQVYLDRHEYGDALAAHREAVEAAESDYRRNPVLLANAYTGMGSAYLAMGRTAEAETAFRRALGFAPYPDAYLNLGVIAFRQRDYKQAYALSLDALRALPVYGMAYNNAGAALLAMGQPASAIPYLNKAIDFSPRYAQARINLAVADLQTDQTFGAITQLRTVLEFDPGNKLANALLDRLLKPPAVEAKPPQ